jgi:hypothetical protein
LSDTLNWEFVGVTADGQPFMVGGLDVWKHEWTDTKERIQVKDPLYQQDFTFSVFQIGKGSQVVTFAAGEFSNCMWGFYTKGRVAAPPSLIKHLFSRGPFR